MKTNIYFMAISLMVLGCSRDDDSFQPVQLDEPIAVNVFCLNSSNDLLRRIEYDIQNRLIRISEEENTIEENDYTWLYIN